MKKAGTSISIDGSFVVRRLSHLKQLITLHRTITSHFFVGVVWLVLLSQKFSNTHMVVRSGAPSTNHFLRVVA